MFLSAKCTYLSFYSICIVSCPKYLVIAALRTCCSYFSSKKQQTDRKSFLFVRCCVSLPLFCIYFYFLFVCLLAIPRDSLLCPILFPFMQTAFCMASLWADCFHKQYRFCTVHIHINSIVNLLVYDTNSVLQSKLHGNREN